MSSNVKRTYGSRPARPSLSSSSPSRLSSSPPLSPKRKRPFDLSFSVNVPRSTKRAKLAGKPQTKDTKKLTQLHFCVDQSILRTCPLCDLSYTKGALDDEALHRTHCARVRKGMEWGKEEEREKEKAGLVQVECGIPLKDGTRGRIVSFPADVSGKLGTKLSTLLETVNLALSSPPLTPDVLQVSKAFLFLVPMTSANKTREKIVGCVIAQRIATAMAVATPAEAVTATGLVSVDPTSSLFAHPNPLPTPLGIPRMFVPLTHRRFGIATRLLSAAAQTSIHGCPLDPTKGQVAFTQPTGTGAAVIQKWCGGTIRVYEG